MSDPSPQRGPGAAAAPDGPAPKVVGFICDWAVDLQPLLERQRLRALPSVHIIRVPCSGFVRPDWVEDALNAGADGVFVTGCPYGDCLNREGNFLMRDRIDALQRRLQRRRIDPARMAMLAHGLHDGDAFIADVRAFVERLATMKPAPAPRPALSPAPAAAAAEPAPVAAAAEPAPAATTEEPAPAATTEEPASEQPAAGGEGAG